MLIPLSGYLPDRQLNILYNLYPSLPDGCKFGWTDLATPEPIEQDLADQISATFAPKVVDQDAIRAEVMLEVVKKYKAKAETLMTNEAFKAMAYQAKQEELKAWQGGERDPAKLKILYAESTAGGITPEQLIAEWEAVTLEWANAVAFTEAVYRKAKVDVANTEFASDEDMQAFIDGVSFDA